MTSAIPLLESIPLYGRVGNDEQKVFNVKLVTETSKGTLLKNDATLLFDDGRIEFVKSPFSLKDEVKAMAGSKWHGNDEKPKKVWSIKDSPRNRFQLQYLMGGNPYEWFDQEIKHFEYPRPLMDHQKDLADAGLTYHYQIWAAEMGVGKTLSAISVMESSGKKKWFWIGPKASLKAIQREFKKWKMDPSIDVELMTYESLTRLMDDWPVDKEPPEGVIFDESSRLKTATSQRSCAAQKLADLIRYHHEMEGYVILMSGTPSPKTPVDWWSQAEIAWPGFLKEGSPKAMEKRMAFMIDAEFDAGMFQQRIGWKDDETKCSICGDEEIAPQHAMDDMDGLAESEAAELHQYQPSVNEVSLLFERLVGLVVVKHKKDCLTLPDKRYRTIVCKPTKSVLRVAQVIAGSAVSAVTGMVKLRELSDGFQYREVADGTSPCSHCPGEDGKPCGLVDEWFDPNDEDRTFEAVDMLDPELVARLEKRKVTCRQCEGDLEVTKYIREVREIPCPKEPALVDLLEENEEHGRLVVFAGFTGSVDRCVNICLRNNWDVVRCDGRGYSVFKVEADGAITNLTNVEPLDYWADRTNQRVAFVSHPESGGMGLTLTEACMEVYWSNSFKPEYRSQSEDRIHRPGIDENKGATIVDLVHLPTDLRVLEVLRANRKLELMTMGDFNSEIADVLRDAETSETGEVLETVET